MIGSWIDEDEDATITTDCEWTKNRNFMTRSFAMVIGDQVNTSGMQIVGWDPVNKQIHSWVFDSDGGFSEGTWTHKGDKWSFSKQGTLPDGGKTSATNIIKHVDDNSFTWQSINRTIDGEMQPNIDEVVINRKPGAKSSRIRHAQPRRLGKCDVNRNVVTNQTVQSMKRTVLYETIAFVGGGVALAWSRATCSPAVDAAAAGLQEVEAAGAAEAVAAEARGGGGGGGRVGGGGGGGYRGGGGGGGIVRLAAAEIWPVAHRACRDQRRRPSFEMPSGGRQSMGSLPTPGAGTTAEYGPAIGRIRTLETSIVPAAASTRPATSAT